MRLYNGQSFQILLEHIRHPRESMFLISTTVHVEGKKKKKNPNTTSTFSDSSPSQSLQVSRAGESAINIPTVGKIHPSTQQLTDANAKTETPTWSSTGFIF